MNGRPRDEIMLALKTFLLEALPEFNTVTRRIRAPGDIKDPDYPALMIDEVAEMIQQAGQRPIWKTTFAVNLWIVLKNGRDPNAEPIVALNGLLDRLDIALTPPPCFESLTLGGLVEYCRIEGTIEKDAGEINGVAMAIVPLRILIP